MYFKNLITNSTTNKKIKWYKRLKNENSNQIMIPLNSLKECIWCKFCWPFQSQDLNNILRTICHQLLRQERSWGGGGSWESHPLPLYKLLLFLTEAKQGWQSSLKSETLGLKRCRKLNSKSLNYITFQYKKYLTLLNIYNPFISRYFDEKLTIEFAFMKISEVNNDAYV